MFVLFCVKMQALCLLSHSSVCDPMCTLTTCSKVGLAKDELKEKGPTSVKGACFWSLRARGRREEVMLTVLDHDGDHRLISQDTCSTLTCYEQSQKLSFHLGVYKLLHQAVFKRRLMELLLSERNHDLSLLFCVFFLSSGFNEKNF